MRRTFTGRGFLKETWWVGLGVGVCQGKRGKGFVGGENSTYQPMETWISASWLQVPEKGSPFGIWHQMAIRRLSSVCHLPAMNLAGNSPLVIKLSLPTLACSWKESPGSELASLFHLGNDFMSWQLRALF